MTSPDTQTEQTEAIRSPFAFSRAELVIMILVLVFYSATRVMPAPDGEPGFIFARISFSATAGEFFEAERRKRREPVESTCECKAHIQEIVFLP